MTMLYTTTPISAPPVVQLRRRARPAIAGSEAKRQAGALIDSGGITPLRKFIMGSLYEHNALTADQLFRMCKAAGMLRANTGEPKFASFRRSLSSFRELYLISYAINVEPKLIAAGLVVDRRATAKLHAFSLGPVGAHVVAHYQGCKVPDVDDLPGGAPALLHDLLCSQAVMLIAAALQESSSAITSIEWRGPRHIEVHDPDGNVALAPDGLLIVNAVHTPEEGEPQSVSKHILIEFHREGNSQRAPRKVKAYETIATRPAQATAEATRWVAIWENARRVWSTDTMPSLLAIHIAKAVRTGYERALAVDTLHEINVPKYSSVTLEDVLGDRPLNFQKLRERAAK